MRGQPDYEVGLALPPPLRLRPRHSLPCSKVGLIFSVESEQLLDLPQLAGRDAALRRRVRDPHPRLRGHIRADREGLRCAEPEVQHTGPRGIAEVREK